MNKKNVLVFPCGSETGLEIYQSVKDSIHFELFGLNSVDDHGKFVYHNYIDGIGFINESNFINTLNDIIQKYKIDLVYPTMDSVIKFLKQNEKLISSPVVGSEYETTEICESKLLTYQKLNGAVKCPTIYDTVNDNLVFPLFVKPIIGYGSRNSYKVSNLSQIKKLDFSKNILLEYLPGDEYTIDCFTNLKRELVFVGARHRRRTVNGISVNTCSNPELTKEFISTAQKINTQIHFKGSWFFQMKKNIENEYTLLEVACRFAGSSSVHRVQGANFALANLFLASGTDIEFIINPIKVELDRALDSKYKLDIHYNEVYIDLDDTIIVNDKINLDAIKFMYQCINSNIRLILITKHIENIEKTLFKYKINNLFDEIIQIKKEDEKFFYLNTNNNPIFIDDSYNERKKVFQKFNIPVFSVDAIKSLIK